MPDLAVHHPREAEHLGAGGGLRGAIAAYRPGWRRCRRPRVVEDATVAVVGELVETEVGHDDDPIPTASARRVRATLRMPPGHRRRSHAHPWPRGHTEDHQAPRPAATARSASATSESRVCWTTPGIDEIGTGSAMPSHEDREHQIRRVQPGLGQRRRTAGERRSRRGRWTGKLTIAGSSGTGPATRLTAALTGATHLLAGLVRGVGTAAP